MENETKVYVVLHTVRLDVSKQYYLMDEIAADPKVLGVFREREDAEFHINQYLPDANVWERYEILERELI